MLPRLSHTFLLSARSSTRRWGQLRLDPEHCDPHIELDDARLTATCITSTKWCSVLASEPITSGVHRWEVILDKCTPTCNIMIGVCERGHNLAHYIGQDTGTATSGWAFYGCNGYMYHNGSSKPYAAKLKQGDVITVELDMESGTLGFSRNGASFGMAFTSGLEDKVRLLLTSVCVCVLVCVYV